MRVDEPGPSIHETVRLRPMQLAEWPNSLGCEAAADVSVGGTWLRDQLPVISLSFAKNARLRWVLIPQFTGGD